MQQASPLHTDAEFVRRPAEICSYSPQTGSSWAKLRSPTLRPAALSVVVPVAAMVKQGPTLRCMTSVVSYFMQMPSAAVCLCWPAVASR